MSSNSAENSDSTESTKTTKSNCATNDKALFTATEQQLAQEKQLAAQAKALAHPARLRILVILSQLERAGGCLNSDLVAELGLAQSTVSEHLRVLREAGFIDAEPQPPKVCYKIKREQVLAMNHLLADIFA